jgi:hypothetical protein
VKLIDFEEVVEEAIPKHLILIDVEVLTKGLILFSSAFIFDSKRVKGSLRNVLVNGTIIRGSVFLVEHNLDLGFTIIIYCVKYPGY